ncbi:MAG: DUF5684 domain-containing protein [Candidatus Saccharimonadales bacterium]
MLEQLAQTYTYTNVSTSSSSALTAGMSLILILFPILWVISIVALWKVFTKAGVPGWKSIIPFYNYWIMFEMAGKPGWWALVGLVGIIPVLGIIAGPLAFVLYILAALELGKAFGKTTTFTVVAMILFSFIGLLIIGFDDSKYMKPATAPAKFA